MTAEAHELGVGYLRKGAKRSAAEVGELPVLALAKRQRKSMDEMNKALEQAKTFLQSGPA